MHITKFSFYGLCGWVLLASHSWAEEAMPMVDMSHHQHSMPQSEATSEANTSSTSQEPMSQHQHGTEIYTASRLDNKWRLDKTATGQWQSELESWIGSDENKFYLKAELDKTESERTEAEIKALYSRYWTTFWDMQAGLRYRQNLNYVVDRHATDFVVGVHGLAPYFFETQAYAYIGQYQYSALYLESSRDVLLTQKWITQPFVKALVVLQDHSKVASKTGLSHAEIGVQTRYEINKRIMPFVEVAYRYDKGLKQTSWQSAEPSNKGWVYGAGLRLNF